VRKYLVLPLAACAAAAMLQAAPIACPTTANLAQLIALSGTGNGCFIQDKLFNNFTYTNLSGTGATPAADVGATLVFQPGSNSQDIHGWIFAPTTGPWTTGFTLGYSIATVAGSGVVITAAKDQSNTGLLPNGDIVTDTQTPSSPGPGGTMVAGSPVTLTTMGTAGHETDQITFSPSATSVTTSTSASIGSGGILQSYEQDWFESAGPTSVPEPAGFTYGLLGSGFLLLGLMRFRKA
jgi:hypothetical protein